MQNGVVTNRRAPTARALVAVAAWFVAALAVGASGALARLPVPPPAVAGAITLTLLILTATSGTVRTHVRNFGLRSFVAFHVTRVAAGAYFLFLYGRGALPAEFALPAGWGDIAVGVAALVLALSCMPMRSPWQRTALLAWNACGLIDILFVLATGVRLFLRDPEIMAMFARLPLALLPTFVVPVVLVTHVLVFIWWRDARIASR